MESVECKPRRCAVDVPSVVFIGGVVERPCGPGLAMEGKGLGTEEGGRGAAKRIPVGG